MKSFEVLDAGLETQRDRWLQVWHSWPEREVSAHPDYVSLFSRPEDRPLCAVMTDSHSGVLYPFILRCLTSEPWAAGYEHWCDLITPYGFGGPYAWGSPDADLFWEEFDGWAKKSNVVSAFARLSLFSDHLLPFAGDTEVTSTSVVRSLDLTHGEIWADYEYKVRKNVQKARRSGLTVEIDMDGSRLQEFFKIYCSTMDRNAAEAQYYFPRDFFQSIVDNLTGQYAFFHVLQETSVVSTELVLISERHIYSFLGGTRAEAFPLRPNDLLKHAVIEWGMSQGKRFFVLGGGYRDDDGIFRYKRSFAPSGRLPFMVGKRIYSLDVYGNLVARRQEWEATAGRNWSPRREYFPEYRS